MNYQESLEFLRQLTKFGFNLGLGRIKELMRRAGSPQERLRFIHIGGTNGKGSVSAMVASILKAAGYRVGLFTSPHLHSYTERIQINGQNIPEERLAALLTWFKPLLTAMVADGYEHPTEFEVGTAVALKYFADEGVDLVVLEVGLGGAIDSTNVIDTSLVSVITNVGMDHMQYLGNTIAEIARVKAGIIKPGGIVVTASRLPEALEVISTTCREKGATLYQVGRDVTWRERRVSLAGGEFDCRGLLATYEGLKVHLLGRHQLENAATAVAVIEAAVRHHGLKVTPDHLRQGLAAATWPARLEIIQREPMVIIDGAHNFDGAVSLRLALEEIFRYRRLILVLGMLADKEREKVVAELAPLAAAVIVTRPNNPRAGNWQSLADSVRRYVGVVEVIEAIPAAVERALALAEPSDLICVTGSLYMVADAREWLKKFKKEESPGG
ncbi:bifunctional folylpolyglutamate synthase/dihydrofolate synthase [Neomoorella thermoacetica]|uniref:bifunctional folylpolyglutamate synthase/dihydrofolate synthase n=1 Tax=Neomoorella thermoacetica TaxID=1525 RepID=UPI0008FAF892|nr:folylpolyglutamate synthase/dihydrofolate synthase family protein [Moorella thermoacetica]APC07647.1 folylpolyglutamate synthase [Moorella thermoacetica]OIQ53649.1 folylpolyglutamate synthase [Moorella thermoacetica]